MTEKENAGASLMKEIKVVEQSISSCYERVYQLKAKLHSGKLSDKHRGAVQNDLQEVEKLLATNKKILKSIHKENRNTFFFASALCLIIFILWMIYHLTFGDAF